KRRKLDEVNELIIDCTGLFAEVSADKFWITSGESVKLNIELVNRSDKSILLEKIMVAGLNYDTTMHVSLTNNLPLKISSLNKVNGIPYSNPYWLREPHSLGLFTVNDKS